MTVKFSVLNYACKALLIKCKPVDRQTDRQTGRQAVNAVNAVPKLQGTCVSLGQSWNNIFRT